MDTQFVLPKILSLVCSSPRTANACSTEATGGPATSSSFDGTVRKCNSECITDSRLLLSKEKEKPSCCQSAVWDIADLRSYCTPQVAAKAILYSPCPQNTVLVQERQKRVQSSLCYSAWQWNANQSLTMIQNSHFSHLAIEWHLVTIAFLSLFSPFQVQRKRVFSFLKEKSAFQWKQQHTDLWAVLAISCLWQKRQPENLLEKVKVSLKLA